MRALALAEFAAAVIGDQPVMQAINEGSIASDDHDRYHAIQALRPLCDWLNKADIEEHRLFYRTRPRAAPERVDPET